MEHIIAQRNNPCLLYPRNRKRVAQHFIPLQSTPRIRLTKTYECLSSGSIGDVASCAAGFNLPTIPPCVKL